MNGIRLALQDIKEMWSSHILRRSVLGLMVLPLLYSFLYLWAFWNPTELVNRLPLAVVNLDRGMTQGASKVNLGQDLANKLIADEKTNWKEVSLPEGEEGINKLDFFILLIIPEDFSEKAYSAGTSAPEQTQLQYRINEGASMLGAKISRTIAETVEKQLQHELTTRYLQVVFENLMEGGEGLQKAADGSAALAAGTDQALNGASALTAGLQETHSGMEKLSAGLADLSKGANQLENGIIRLDTVAGLSSAAIGKTAERLQSVVSASEKLSSDLDALSAGAQASISELRSGRQAIASVADSINTSAQAAAKLRDDALAPVNTTLEKQRAAMDELNRSLVGLFETNPELKNSEAGKRVLTALENAYSYRQTVRDDMEQAKRSVEQLRADMANAHSRLKETDQSIQKQTDQLKTALNRIHSGISSLSGKLKNDAALASLPEQLSSLSENIHKLQEGSTALVNGLQTFSQGFSRLQEGNTRLLDGANQLSSGLGEISRGQHELTQKLQEAAGMAKQDGKVDQRVQVIADPVLAVEQNLHPVPNNGTGFAPYFLALSLWVGSLVLFFVIDIKKVYAMPKRPISYITNKYFALASVSILQAVISVFILHAGLGVHTELPPLLLYGFAILIGLCFTAILFMLLSVLGNDVGRFAAVLILMLQLTSSSGSYPVELEPGLFSFIQPFLPMTYAVEGLRQLISVGNTGILQIDALALFLFGLGALVLLYVTKRRSIFEEISQSA
ncbi:YhgE/Pip family protein [Brevibacillus borstelensis]|uniref:YhgE/Pip family protein n=1 Tax=Brevibacillus borstelensis TaxID=45462 RepID=UPI0030BBE1A1